MSRRRENGFSDAHVDFLTAAAADFLEETAADQNHRNVTYNLPVDRMRNVLELPLIQ